MKKNDKKTTEKSKVRIAVATGLAVGAVIGGTVMYIMNGDSIKLGKLLKEYGKNKEGETLVNCLTEYAKNSYWFYHVTPRDDAVSITDLASGAEAIVKWAVEDGHEGDNVTALIAFTKK